MRNISYSPVSFVFSSSFSTIEYPPHLSYLVLSLVIWEWGILYFELLFFIFIDSRTGPALRNYNHLLCSLRHLPVHASPPIRPVLPNNTYALLNSHFLADTIMFNYGTRGNSITPVWAYAEFGETVASECRTVTVIPG